MNLDALWINVSPSLRKLDQPLLDCLGKEIAIAEWRYLQEVDDASCLSTAINLLHRFINKLPSPIHLLGHGISGSLALMYARQHPDKIRSLTLLSVGVYPAMDWHSYYYTKLQSSSCCRRSLLTTMVDTLFGYQCNYLREEFREILDQDLWTSLCPHNLYQEFSIFPGRITAPLLVCGSRNDVIIDQNLLHGWRSLLKEQDALWQCPRGRYFFHYFYPHTVAQQIMGYWEGSNLLIHPSHPKSVSLL